MGGWGWGVGGWWVCFFFNDTATTEIYTLSLHDALPIYRARVKLLCHIHNTADETSMETAYGYDPINDLSFTGEFEAIGA